MSVKPIELSIFRLRVGRIDPPRFQSFRIDANEELTVLDALERVRLTMDGTLMYRHSCHHSSCGTCACRINGSERLACTTRLLDLGTGTVSLEPLRGFPIIGDLAVRMDALYRDIDPAWSCLKPVEPANGAGAEQDLLRFEDCIECGCCVSACRVVRLQPDFMGPAALAALRNEALKNPVLRQDLLRRAGSERGERRCERALSCSRVCPTGAYPARHIADLRRELKER